MANSVQLSPEQCIDRGTDESEEVERVNVLSQLEKLKQDPKSVLEKPFQYHKLIKNLHFVGSLPKKKVYKTNGEAEIFIYDKNNGERPAKEHTVTLDWDGEHDLAENVYCSYFSDEERAIVARCIWHAAVLPPKKGKNKELNKGAPMLVVVISNGVSMAGQIGALSERQTETDNRLNVIVEKQAETDDIVNELEHRMARIELVNHNNSMSSPQPQITNNNYTINNNYNLQSPVLVPHVPQFVSPQQIFALQNNNNYNNTVITPLPGHEELFPEIVRVLRNSDTPLAAREIMKRIKENNPLLRDLVQKPINVIVYHEQYEKKVFFVYPTKPPTFGFNPNANVIV